MSNICNLLSLIVLFYAYLLLLLSATDTIMHLFLSIVKVHVEYDTVSCNLKIHIQFCKLSVEKMRASISCNNTIYTDVYCT